MRGLNQQQLRSIDQELKEAICNSIVNLTVSRVSASGEEGQYIYGSSPRRAVVSGQLLPRFDERQQDDTSDIKIAAIGIDFQVDEQTEAEAVFEPRFSTYVRILPEWNEINDDDLGLEIEFELVRATQQEIDGRIIQLRTERFIAANVARPQWQSLSPTQKQEVRDTRNRIQQEVRLQAYRERGIQIEPSDEDMLAHRRAEEEADGSAEPAEARLRIGRLLQRGRIIPYSLLAPADAPAKWKRIVLVLPQFRWRLSRAESELASELAAYSARLRQEVVEQVTAWLLSEEGRRDAWRNLKVAPSDIGSLEAWQAFRTRAESIPVPVQDLLPKVDGVVLQIDRLRDYVDVERASIRVTLDNGTTEATRRESKTKTDILFNAGFTIRFPRNDHRSLKLDRVEPSYRFRNFLNYHAIGLNCGVEYSYVEADIVLSTTWAPRFIQPRILPRRIENLPVSFSILVSEQFDVSELLRLPREYTQWAENEIQRLRNVVRTGLDREQADAESRRLEQDTAAQKQEAAFIERGIQLLVESQAAFRQVQKASASQKQELLRRAAPYKAWLLTNRSFLLRENGNTERGWRLFQLAFILAHIPTLASRMEEFRNYQNPLIDEDAASLLYFPTGGGKSEAFYGTLLFALFVDRLRGKHRGVTAMIRYPLRLLTLQQGQRLLKLITHAEMLRREEQEKDGLLGDWPFEIGFWVGGTNTPNRYSQVPAVVPQISNDEHPNDQRLEETARFETDKARKDAIRYREFRAAYNKVPECPICNTPTGLRRFETENGTGNHLGIVCFNRNCRFNVSAGEDTPLPFLLTDDTIYQRAPSVVLGTIDKMAMLGHSTNTIRQLIGMFGLARAISSEGHLNSPWIETGLVEKMRDDNYQEVFPSFRRGQRVFHDPFPSLIIQDEAHLLEESLGTFSGLFDTLLETVLKRIADIAGIDLGVSKVWDGQTWGGPRLPKVIAATATISNPDRQLEVLYQRRVLRFPYPGSDIYRSFFAAPEIAPQTNLERTALEVARGIDSSPELTAPWMRLFVSIMTNNFTHTVTTVSILGAFHTIITQLWRGLVDESRRDSTIAKLIHSQGNDVSSSWRRNAIERAVREGRFAEIMALIDLHRIALAYVTNKKGGDQVMDALASAVKQQHRLSHEELDNFVSRLISGGIDMREIQEIMEEAEASNPGEEYGELGRLIRSIVATSAISHGVDVDRFNSMFFAGLPSDIAEYIQASSRVGRTHVGFVVLVPTPQSRRDRYVVETHDIFHRFLERMIAPPAVERWAENALKRVMASLVQAWASMKEAQLFLAAADDAKDDVDSYDVTAPIAAYAKRDILAFTDEIGSFVLRAIGFEGRGEARYGSPVYQDLYRSLIEQEVMNFGNSMRKLNTSIKFREYWKDSSAAYKPPMTSLRDVDEAGVITGGSYDMSAQSGQRKINVEHLITVMRAIRSQRGTVSEMDLDAPEENQA